MFEKRLPFFLNFYIPLMIKYMVNELTARILSEDSQVAFWGAERVCKASSYEFGSGCGVGGGYVANAIDRGLHDKV